MSRWTKLKEQRIEESVVLREGIFMASYRAVIQSVWTRPSDQKSGLGDNQRECGVKSAQEEQLLCLFENNHSNGSAFGHEDGAHTQIFTDISLHFTALRDSGS